MTDRFFVYVHRKADTGEVFYVGKGTVQKKDPHVRAYYTKKRSKFWQAIVEKHGLKVEIVMELPTEALAFELESGLIAHFGKRSNGGCLCNLTDGGEGHKGHSPTEETRAKLSAAFSGESHPNWGKKLSDETRAKKSESMKLSPHSLRGKRLPDWWKERIAAAKIGERNPMSGKRGLDHPNTRSVILPGYGYVFASVQSAADFFGINMKSLHNMLSGHRKNTTNLEFA